jgi:site-specific DNA recombinase
MSEPNKVVLDRYPPPQPNRKDDNGLPPTWSRSVVRSILRNPKYTGYNVWGRHDKRRGRPLIRPHSDWTWSTTPTHEPILSKELLRWSRTALVATRPK